MLTRENEQLLHETGLFRFHQPKAFGGMELDFVAVVDITGGDRARLSVDGVERRQPRLPSLDPRLLRSRNPARGVGRQPGCADRLLHRARGRPRAQGGRRIHRLRPLAVLLRRRQLRLEHAGRHRLRRRRQDAIDWRLCLVPKSDYEIIDTWYAMGMGATGSKDIKVTEQFVPERRALALQRCAVAAPSIRAARSSRGRCTALPIVAASSHPLAPAAIGAAEGAYEMFIASMAQAHGHLYGRQGRRFPGRADQGGARALPDQLRPQHRAPVGHRHFEEARAQRGS